MSKELIKDIILSIKLFLFWRVGLLLIAYLADHFLPFKPSFPFYDSILVPLSKSQFIWQWANFDGVHYITIAEKGYIGTGSIQAFFPLYSIIIRMLNHVVKNLLYSGLIVSNLTFLLSLYFFQRLIRVEKIKYYFSPTIFLLLFPTSFYFGTLYSESLFFLLSVLAFIFMNKKKWFWAAVFASLASATRLVGVFIGLALLYEFWQDKQKKTRFLHYIKIIILSIISITGLIVFCSYLFKNFGDPFYFVRLQSAFGASRQTDKIILLHQVIWRYIKMIFTVQKNSTLFYTVSQEFVLTMVGLGVLIWGWFKKIKKSYLVYSFGSLILPTLTGNFSSMPRYLSVIFPTYIILSQIKNKKLQTLLLIISSILLIINTSLFLRGFWVA